MASIETTSRGYDPPWCRVVVKNDSDIPLDEVIHENLVLDFLADHGWKVVGEYTPVSGFPGMSRATVERTDRTQGPGLSIEFYKGAES